MQCAVCGANSADGFLVQVQVANALRNCHGSRCEPLSSTTMVRHDQNMLLWCPRLSCCLLTGLGSPPVNLSYTAIVPKLEAVWLAKDGREMIIGEGGAPR